MNAAQQAFVWACTLDVMVSKPGNVSVHSEGHGMTASMFIASANAAAPALTAVGMHVRRGLKKAAELDGESILISMST